MPDDMLPAIPQRTAAWFQVRRGAVTASSAAVWLGMKEPGSSKIFAGHGLSIFAAKGQGELQHAFQQLLSAEPNGPSLVRSPFAACAMEMGTIKEADVLLTYAAYMDATREYASGYHNNCRKPIAFNTLHIRIKSTWSLSAFQCLQQCWFRCETLRMHEVGAALLQSIPPDVQQFQPPLVEKLPRIMASCDALVKDSGTGQLVRLVEAKHRFPFAPPARPDGKFTYLGRSRAPQKQISCEQFAQCQMQMLVMDCKECDLISFSLGGSRIFHIKREAKWLAIALQLLEHMQQNYIALKKQPQPDALMTDKPALYKSFISETVAAMQQLERQNHTEVASAVERSKMTPYFLDKVSPADASRIQTGEARPQTLTLAKQ